MPEKTKTVMRAGSIMMVAILLSRILGMLRDTVMVAQFGIGLDTDSYRIAVQIPDFIFMLIAGGGLSSAFIPVFSELIYTDREDEAWKVFGSVVTIVSMIALVLIIGAWALTPQIVGFFQGAHPASVLPKAILMSRIMLPAQFAFLVGSLLLATLYARKQFMGPALAPNVYNLGIIGAATILPGLLGLGIESMAWGALAGAMVGNLLLPAIQMARIGSRFQPSFDTSLTGVRKFFVLLLPVILGFSLPSMVNIVTQKFASSYGSEGVNTVLALANNLMQAPLGIFGQSLALAAFPVLAEFVARGQMDLYRAEVSKTLRQVIFLGFPSAAILAGLAPQIVRSLYGYGAAAGNARDLAYTAQCLQIYSVAIFAWCMQPVLMRGFFSLHKTFKPVLIGTIMTGLFIALCAWATHASPDFRLIPWATNIAAILLAVVLFFALEGDVGALDRKGIGLTILKSAGAAALAGAVAFGLAQWIPVSSRAIEIPATLFVALVAAWVYFFAGRSLRMPETDYLERAMRRLERKPKG
ncbi:MAG: murein biosynthesis integral membrane protein MurJ [Fimbriimonas sp.]